MSIIKSKKADNLMECFEKVFKFMFLILTLVSFNNCITGTIILKCFSYLTVAVGGVVVIYRLFNFKNYIKTYSIFILVAFVFSYFITSIINYKYGFIENLQAMVWMVFQFGILYSFDKNKTPDYYKKELNLLLKTFLIYIAFCNIISIFMLFMNYGYPEFTSPTGNNIGFLWGRLWGIYSDPNNGAVFCSASIVLSLYYFVLAKNKFLKVAHILNIILSLSYMAFSDSRTGFVCLACELIVYSYFNLNATKFNSSKAVIKQAACFFLSVIISITGILAISVIKFGYNLTAEAVYSYRMNHNSDKPNSNNKPSVTIERNGDELDEDISNRRFDLWNSGLEIWKDSAVFGVGHRSLTAYAEENLPNTYLVNNDLGKFKSSHNMLIDLLASQGIIGMAFFALFVVMIVVLIFKKFLLDKKRIKDKDLILYLSLLIVFASSSMFVLEILYVNTAGSFLFWYILGYLIKKLTFKEKTDEIS